MAKIAGRSFKKVIGVACASVVSAAAAMLSTALSATPAFGAERITFFYPPFGEFSLSVDSLEVFAKSGKITREFRFYAQRVNPEQLAKLRPLLLGRLPVTPTLVSQFTYSPVGQKVLQRLGVVLQTDARLSGFHALRSSLILSAADSQQGLTILNALRRFPSRSIRLNLSYSRQIAKELSELLRERSAVVTAITQLTAAEVATSAQVNFSRQADLRLPGSFRWQLQTLNLNDRSRNRTISVDLYLPYQADQTNSHSAPVIVVSHGAAEDRTSFTYLARHLVSYGFAVAVLDHPGSDSQRFGQYFAGLAGPPEPLELINQPLEVTYVLDQLQQIKFTPVQTRLNLQQVGVIGHSLGGYAALTLAGATINSELDRDCRDHQSLNISILVQCRAAELLPITDSLQDKRVKAVIAVNPVTSIILGEKGLSQIQVPLMLVAGSADVVTPVVPEQIRPFTWLTTVSKYLVLIENATHFSAVGELASEHAVLPVPPALVGPNPAIARSYLSALSVAFFQTHIANRPEYRSYLSASYAKFINQTPLNLNLVQSFTANQLAETLNQVLSDSVSSEVQIPTSSPNGVNRQL